MNFQKVKQVKQAIISSVTRKQQLSIGEMCVFLGIVLVGLVLALSTPIKDTMVSMASDTSNQSVLDMSKEQIEENKLDGINADYDFSGVRELDLWEIIAASISSDKVKQGMVGGIAIPSVNISESIYNGVSNKVLAIGVGTMKQNQKLGEGNYALAGHTMNNKTLLFGQLANVELGDKVYLTDKEYVYTYQINYKGKAKPKDVHVIEDVDGRTLLTLVTCTDKGKNRLIVQAEYVGKVELKETSKDVINKF